MTGVQTCALPIYLILSSDGVITGSNVLFDGGKVGGFTIDSHSISNENVRLTIHETPGLVIKNKFDDDVIYVASKSFTEIGATYDEVINDGFETGTWSAGRNASSTRLRCL